jgi:hypothetical protein
MTGEAWILHRDDMDRVDRKVMEDILREGWSDIAVFPTRDDPTGTLPFNYTIGLAELNHPDLIVMGLDNRQMHMVLVGVVDSIKEGQVFHPNTYYGQVLVGLRVAFVQVDDPLHHDYPMNMVERFYGEVHALQLVWPDTQDRFPWHPDFDLKFVGQQTVLGTWSHE